MIFDDDQALPLSSLDPAKVVGLELMHPIRRTTGKAEVGVAQGRLVIRAEAASDTSVWFSGFNPFATYQLEIADCGDGSRVGLEFVHTGGEVLRVEAVGGRQSLRGVRWGLKRGDEMLVQGEAEDFKPRTLEKPVTLIVQMAAVGFNVYLRQHG